jgi:hypothetical protein
MVAKLLNTATRRGLVRTIAGVRKGAMATGTAASEVLTSAGGVARQANELKGDVERLPRRDPSRA